MGVGRSFFSARTQSMRPSYVLRIPRKAAGVLIETREPSAPLEVPRPPMSEIDPHPPLAIFWPRGRCTL